MILDAWAQASNILFSTERYGDVAIVRIKGREIYLLKPSTYVNLSGNAVRYWLQKLDIPLEQAIIICDDVNLPFGTIRMRKAGSDGGHNGLKNIAALLETTAYARVRLGVGHEFEQGSQIDYVLGSFDEEQMAEISKIAAKLIAGLKDWIFIGIERAMSNLNAKSAKKAE